MEKNFVSTAKQQLVVCDIFCHVILSFLNIKFG